MIVTRRKLLQLIVAAPAVFGPLRAFGQSAGQAGTASAGTTASATAVAPPKPLDIGAPGKMKIAYHGRFSELPVGAVRPEGWIKGWLKRQAEGMTGHPENLAYPYDTCMYSGQIPNPSVRHGQDWWPYEQSGYFVDGAVRLSLLIDDAGTKKISESNLKYILEHSGPAKLGESHWGWPNTVVGRALMAEHSATGDSKTAQVLGDCLLGTRRLGGRDGYIFEEALYLYGLSGDERLLEIAKKDYGNYFMDDPESFSFIEKIKGTNPLRQHGVTAAEQLKLLPLMYSYTGDAQALELAKLAYAKVEKDSLMPDGGIVSSESLGTAVINSLHETCDITDWSWSFGYMLMASGDGHWADRIEQAAFNALPGAVTKDFKQLQYFSSPNQVLASNTACPRIAPTRLSYRAAHDTECCSGNVNRAMPNYVARMWMGMEDGLAATLYGPSQVETAINGKPVAITEETDYPFRETISFTVKASEDVAFSLALRIPEWCPSAAIAVNGKASDAECKPGSFAIVKRAFKDGDKIELKLPMTVEVKEWFGGRAASVQRGPLVYSLQIDEDRKESAQDSAPIKKVLKGNDIAGFPAIEFYPKGEWRYGMDKAITSAPNGAAGVFKVVESPMPENPFIAATAPVRIEAPLRAIPQWQADWKPLLDPAPAGLKAMPKNPADLPAKAELQSAGAGKPVTLIPLGATHLRLTTFPVIA